MKLLWAQPLQIWVGTKYFPKPLFHGDTIRVETEILDKRLSNSRPDNGIVIFQHRAFNQKDELVASCKRSGLMLRNSDD